MAIHRLTRQVLWRERRLHLAERSVDDRLGFLRQNLRQERSADAVGPEQRQVS